MKKWIIKLIILAMSVGTISVFPLTSASAENNITPKGYYAFDGYGGYTYKKKNVKYSKSYSKYKRVSDNLNTFKTNKGDLSVVKGVSFDTSVSGEIKGLGISLNRSISSEVGYSLEVPKNKVVYLGYRAKYKVEKGTRVEYSFYTVQPTGKKNSYTVKKPIHGEYAVIVDKAATKKMKAKMAKKKKK